MSFVLFGTVSQCCDATSILDRFPASLPAASGLVKLTKTLPARWMLIANADAATPAGGGWVRRHPDGARTKQDRPDFPERDWPVSQVHNNQSHEANDDDMIATTMNPIQTGSRDVMNFFVLLRRQCDIWWSVNVDRSFPRLEAERLALECNMKLYRTSVKVTILTIVIIVTTHCRWWFHISAD